MSDYRVLVFGEGPSELGPRSGEGREAHDDLDLPALARLTHRLLQEPNTVTYTGQRFKSVKAVHGKGVKYAKKTKAAIRQAQKHGYDAAVVVIDRDGKPDKERIEAIRAGRDEMLSMSAMQVQCAVGTAVETFDAWMIADGKALQAADGDGSRSHGQPEHLTGKEGSGNHPKDKAGELLGGKSDLARKYAVIAGAVDLSALERACPVGFKPFADEVREHIAPVVSE